MKRLIALALAVVFTLLCSTCALAAEKKPDFMLVGKGATEERIVLDLNGDEKVSVTFYLLSPKGYSYPGYLLSIDGPGYNSGAEVTTKYEPALGQYSVTVTAKKMVSTQFSVIVYGKGTGAYVQKAIRSYRLEVLDGDSYAYWDKEYSDEELAKMQSEAKKINVTDGIAYAPEGGTVVADISENAQLSISALKALKKRPDNTLKLAGERYYWEFTGKDVNYQGKRLAEDVSVELQNNLLREEMRKASGKVNITAIRLPARELLPENAVLGVRSSLLKGSATAKLYKYSGGKAALVQAGLPVDEDGWVSFTLPDDGNTWFLVRG